MIEEYSDMVQKIFNRTNGLWQNFTFIDKIVCKVYFTLIYQEFEDNLPIIRFWKDLEIETPEVEKESENRWLKQTRI